jgi:hypothetical protein
MPTAATEVLLGLPPFQILVKMAVEAQAGIYRLSFSEQWKAIFTWYGHASEVQDMIKEPILHMRTDKMILRCIFYKPFS